MNDNDHDGREAYSHNEKFPPWWVFADDVDDDEGDDIYIMMQCLSVCLCVTKIITSSWEFPVTT